MKDTNNITNSDLAALVGARICHDLISPIGAASNGLELVEMQSSGVTDESRLVADCISDSSAKLQFFRLAFGAADNDTTIPPGNVERIAAGFLASTRISLNWSAPIGETRLVSKIICLAILCLQSALPEGGTIEVSRSTDVWSCCGTGQPLNCNGSAWNVLDGGANRITSPRDVHFAVLADLARARARLIKTEQADSVELKFIVL
jgi:histidine phosphotransferase ChpT